MRAARALEILPGVALAAAVMLAAGQVARFAGAGLLRIQGLDPEGRASPISSISVSILIGLVAANTLGTAAVFRPGLAFAVKRILRLGIILVGIKLSFFDVVKLGAWGVPVVATIIVVALLAATFFARWIGVSDRLGVLAAASTAICGVTAALAVGPTIDAEEREVAYTVANVTLFGLLAMLAYPYLAHALFHAQSGSIGLFLGTGIHDTSQVMGAALSFKEIFGDERALQVATVTKLTRNVFLVAVVPVLAYLHARRTGRPGERVRIGKLFPLFVLGFLRDGDPSLDRGRVRRAGRRGVRPVGRRGLEGPCPHRRGDLGGRRAGDRHGCRRPLDERQDAPDDGLEAPLRRRPLGRARRGPGPGSGGARGPEAPVVSDDPEILCEGRHMRFLRRRGWEYAEHRTAKEAAMVVALTDDGSIVLVEEFRHAVDAPVISLPAGLVGDEGPEEAETAARRELTEETGYEAVSFEPLGRGPGSAGQSSELITFFLARSARKAGEQAPHDRGMIRVHTVAVPALPGWAREREAEGALVDPKIWAGLYLAGLRSSPGA